MHGGFRRAADQTRKIDFEFDFEHDFFCVFSSALTRGMEQALRVLEMSLADGSGHIKLPVWGVI